MSGDKEKTPDLAEMVRELVERMDRRSLDNDIWDAYDISIFIRLNKKTIQNHYLDRPGFPKPLILPTGGRRWYASEVKEWVARLR